jgi:hypothetical protein
MIQKITSDIIPYDGLIRALCLTPYYGHKQGCINYNKKHGCPPRKILNEYFDLDKELFVIYTSFLVGMFAEKMRLSHPEWKENTYPTKQPENNISKITNMLREKHPEWPEQYYPTMNKESWKSSRQWYNPRRWQGTARKQHTQELVGFQKKYPDLVVERCPEALGVNITGLMNNLGIKMNWEWPPEHKKENKTYVVSIAGHLLP